MLHPELYNLNTKGAYQIVVDGPLFDWSVESGPKRLYCVAVEDYAGELLDLVTYFNLREAIEAGNRLSIMTGLKIEYAYEVQNGD